MESSKSLDENRDMKLVKRFNKKKIISLILKLIVFLAAGIGTFLSAYAGRKSFMGGNTVFMYFTIQSNIAVAIICLVGVHLMLANRKINHVMEIIKYMSATSISLTGLVFCIVLAPTLGVYAWNPQNILTHVVVPIAAVADFFVVGQKYSYRKVEALWAIVPPMLYVIYAGVGFICGWEFSEGITYPYFFLNWGSEAGAIGFSKQLPFAGPVWWITIVLGLLVLIGLGYFKILSALRKKSEDSAK